MQEHADGRGGCGETWRTRSRHPLKPDLHGSLRFRSTLIVAGNSRSPFAYIVQEACRSFIEFLLSSRADCLDLNCAEAASGAECVDEATLGDLEFPQAVGRLFFVESRNDEQGTASESSFPLLTLASEQTTLTFSIWSAARSEPPVRPLCNREVAASSDLFAAFSPFLPDEQRTRGTPSQQSVYRSLCARPCHVSLARVGRKATNAPVSRKKPVMSGTPHAEAPVSGMLTMTGGGFGTTEVIFSCRGRCETKAQCTPA